MVAAVTVRKNGFVEFAYTGEPAWHGMGNVLPQGMSLEAWQEAAGMDWTIVQTPAGMYVPERMVDGEILPAGYVEVEGKNVLYRSDNFAPLGVLSDSYKIVQPKEILEFFRDLTEEAGFTMETAGTLFDGKRFWALARATQDAAIFDADDKVGGFVLLSTSADGTLATEARLTTVRVVCNNTLSLARAEGSKNAVKTRHKSVFKPDAAKHTLGLKPEEIRESFETAMDGFRRMAKTRVTANDTVRMTLELFGCDVDNMTDEEIEKASRMTLAKRIGSVAAGQNLIGSNLAGGSGSAWSWLNAVTQYVDHMATTKSAAHRLDAAWFGKGNDLKMKAHEIAMVTAGNAPSVTYNAQEAAQEGIDGLLGDVLAATAEGN